MKAFDRFLVLREKSEVSEKDFSLIIQNINKEEFFKIKEYMKGSGGYVNHLSSFKSIIDLKKKEKSF